MAKRSYYAVKEGRSPGVYETWAECEAQVKGHPGAKYKKFPTAQEAEAFVKGVEISLQKADNTVSRNDMYVPDGPYAFVDGSYNAETGVYGYGGFLCADGRRYPIQGRGSDEEMAAMRNVAGEIEGSMAAVRKAEELHIRELTMLYDYKGIEEWACGRWAANKKGTIEYAEFMNSDNRLTHVVFQKVEAHTGIEGNEMADVMAKNAVGIALTPSQEKLLMKALNQRNRDGVDLSMPDIDQDEATFV